MDDPQARIERSGPVTPEQADRRSGWETMLACLAFGALAVPVSWVIPNDATLVAILAGGIMTGVLLIMLLRIDRRRNQRKLAFFNEVKAQFMPDMPVVDAGDAALVITVTQMPDGTGRLHYQCERARFSDYPTVVRQLRQLVDQLALELRQEQAELN